MTKRALLSVSNKTNLVTFAESLVKLNYEIISTGGTLKTLVDSGIQAVAVDAVTEFPEILDGRVKTLHPAIHGGLLADVSNEKHQKQLDDLSIQAIDLVVVNLYPFKETLIKDGVTHQETIENIDIGGPTMLRAAAKNYRNVTVVVDPTDYEAVIDTIQNGAGTEAFRQQLAAKVFRHTAHYDALIANYFTTQTEEKYPETFTVTYEKKQDLRYGENPHQEAAFYKEPLPVSASLAHAKQRHGKELSYNNIQDANAALEILAEYKHAASAVAVKHMNPCGIGTADTISEAFNKAYKADPVSIFGGIVALNKPVDAETAEALSGIFLEIVIAPAFTEAAYAILTEKKNIRLLELSQKEITSYVKSTSINGGVLIQSSDSVDVDSSKWEVATKLAPSEAVMDDLRFAFKAVKHVKSNAIVLAKDGQTIGIGAGQMNRIGAANIAIEQAKEKAKGSVMASEAFFPMPDTVEAAVKAGVVAIVQPGGSKRDQDSIDVCNQYGIAMVFTGTRHFKH